MGYLNTDLKLKLVPLNSLFKFLNALMEISSIPDAGRWRLYFLGSGF